MYMQKQRILCNTY